MSLIDSHVDCSALSITQYSNKQGGSPDREARSVSCPAPNKAASHPRVEMPSFHSHEETGPKKTRTHGHTGDLSIRQHHPSMHLQLHPHMLMHRHLYIVRSPSLCMQT